MASPNASDTLLATLPDRTPVLSFASACVYLEFASDTSVCRWRMTRSACCAIGIPLFWSHCPVTPIPFCIRMAMPTVPPKSIVIINHAIIVIVPSMICKAGIRLSTFPVVWPRVSAYRSTSHKRRYDKTTNNNCYDRATYPKTAAKSAFKCFHVFPLS